MLYTIVSEKYTPLMIAAYLGHSNCVATLLRFAPLGYMHMKSTLWGKTALILAVERGHLPCVKHLAAQWNAPLDQMDNMKNTPLMYACLRGDVEAVDLLQHYGATIDQNTAYLERMTTLRRRPP